MCKHFVTSVDHLGGCGYSITPSTAFEGSDLANLRAYQHVLLLICVCGQQEIPSTCNNLSMCVPVLIQGQWGSSRKS